MFFEILSLAMVPLLIIGVPGLAFVFVASLVRLCRSDAAQWLLGPFRAWTGLDKTRRPRP